MAYIDQPDAHSYSDLQLEPLHTSVRAGTPSASLRILRISTPESSGYYYHLGQNRWYDAYDIVGGVVLDDLCSNPMFDEPLPEPVDPAKVLNTFNSNNFGQLELELIYDLLSGSNREYLITRIGGRPVYEEIMIRARSLGVEVMNAKHAKVLADEVRNRRAGAIMIQVSTSRGAATNPDTDPSNPDANPSTPTRAHPPHTPLVHPLYTITRTKHADPNDPGTSDNASLEARNVVLPAEGNIGPVTRVPDHIMERMIAQQAAREARGPVTGRRMAWPFKSMQVGEQVFIDGPLALKARAAAHTYASRNKWNLVVHRNRATGGVVVTRFPNKEE